MFLGGTVRANLRQTRREVPDILRLEPRGRYLYRERGGDAESCSDLAGLDSWKIGPAIAEVDAPNTSKVTAERRFRRICEPASQAVAQNEISQSVQYPVKTPAGGSDDYAGCTRRKLSD